jgi:hypothetical protein
LENSLLSEKLALLNQQQLYLSNIPYIYGSSPK